MQNKPQKSQKVLFIRIDETTYKAIAALADQEERSINSMTTRLLRTALSNEGV